LQKGSKPFKNSKLQMMDKAPLFVPNVSIAPLICNIIVFTMNTIMKVIYQPGANALNLEK
jgi:hypothetical protein